MARYHDAGLRSWSIVGNEISNPSFNKKFTHSPTDVSTFWVTHVSETGSVHTAHDVANYPHAANEDALTAYRTKYFKAGVNFISDLEQHASGLNMVGSSNPNIQIFATYENAIPSTTVAVVTVVLSVVMEVTGSNIFIHRAYA
ncbi:hypothetical protein HK097_006040 [Rhizophlyctis rosea]|uniref:Uncharacterized protein n=1 Tax=Rhizophlyctis rosea TaxID=64517 RepID=A0AAD5SD40_9FUNG|nr:hypothetical protein HK097_006040 [Rhizophlyctis rosea]